MKRRFKNVFKLSGIRYEWLLLLFLPIMFYVIYIVYVQKKYMTQERKLFTYSVCQDSNLSVSFAENEKGVYDLLKIDSFQCGFLKKFPNTQSDLSCGFDNNSEVYLIEKFDNYSNVIQYSLSRRDESIFDYTKGYVLNKHLFTEKQCR